MVDNLFVLSLRQTSTHDQRDFSPPQHPPHSLPCLPPPLRHVPALKALVRELHTGCASRGDSNLVSERLCSSSSSCAQGRSRRTGCPSAWHGLSEEVDFNNDGGEVKDGIDEYEVSPTFSPYLGQHPRACFVFRGPGDPSV